MLFLLVEIQALFTNLTHIHNILIVYAIEGENFSTGIGLSSKVEQAVQKVVEKVSREVQNAIKQTQTNYS